MGCVYEDETLALKVEGKYAGLHIEVRQASLETYDRLLKAGKRLSAAAVIMPGGIPDEGTAEANATLAREIAPLITSWDLEDKEHNPIPVADFPKLGMPFQLAITLAWLASLNAYADEVTAPGFDESEIPMEVMGG